MSKLACFFCIPYSRTPEIAPPLTTTTIIILRNPIPHPNPNPRLPTPEAAPQASTAALRLTAQQPAAREIVPFCSRARKPRFSPFNLFSHPPPPHRFDSHAHGPGRTTHPSETHPSCTMADFRPSTNEAAPPTLSQPPQPYDASRTMVGGPVMAHQQPPTSSSDNGEGPAEQTPLTNGSIRTVGDTGLPVQASRDAPGIKVPSAEIQKNVSEVLASEV